MFVVVVQTSPLDKILGRWIGMSGYFGSFKLLFQKGLNGNIIGEIETCSKKIHKINNSKFEIV